MLLKGLIFDLDGTLGDTLPVCFAAFRETFRKYMGRDFSDTEIRALFGPSEEGIFQRLMAERWEHGLRDYLAAYREAHLRCQAPFPGMADALSLLRRSGIAVAIVTGKGPQSACISLEALGLADAFAIVEAGAAAGGVKPRSMGKIVAGWGFDPAHVACLGDSASDIRSAREIGATALGAAWAPTSDYNLLAALAPDQVFRDVPEFIAWLGKALGRCATSNGEAKTGQDSR